MGERSVHDNNVYAFSVHCDRRRIILHTEYKNGDAEEYTDVIFSGVVAHYFEDVMSGNILFGIEEVGVAQIVGGWSGLFAHGKNYGWPEGIEYKDADELISILSRRAVKAFEIGSSFGMGGWVLAESMALRERDARAENSAE